MIAFMINSGIFILIITLILVNTISTCQSYVRLRFACESAITFALSLKKEGKMVDIHISLELLSLAKDELI